MLKEFTKLRQDKKSYRRLFSDDQYDLYVWYPTRDMVRIVGFQLVYKSGMDEKALTWTETGGFLHTKVDDGDKKTNQSPILVADGLFEYSTVYPGLAARIEGVESAVRDFVMEKIGSYDLARL
jgi:hypothetical protein